MAERILVADDDAPIANVVARKLANAGFDVVIARDGNEAREMALADPPDLMVSDHQMPGMDGLEVCRRLADTLDTPVPTIMLTAKGYELRDEGVDDLPVRRIMTKPFSPRDLLTQVREVLNETRTATTKA